MATLTELRCQLSCRRLFGKLLAEEGADLRGVQVEFACGECKKAFRFDYPDLVRVVHRFNLVGELLETEVVRSTGHEKVLIIERNRTL